MADNDEPIRTWGGRLYLKEPAKIDEWTGAVLRTFEYKLLNVLIQGSAADCTKEAMIRLQDAIDKHPEYEMKILIQVHDELVAEINTNYATQGLALMRTEMDGVEFEVPMASDGFKGRNFALMKEVG